MARVRCGDPPVRRTAAASRLPRASASIVGAKSRWSLGGRIGCELDRPIGHGANITNCSRRCCKTRADARLALTRLPDRSSAPPHRARTDRARSAPPARAARPARRRDRSAAARRRARVCSSVGEHARASPAGSPARPTAACRASRRAPRSRRSSSAMRKPSLVSRISASRARDVSLSARAAQQQADRPPAAAPDAAAQLVELGEAEAVGMLDHDQRRVGHVDADLDHRRRDQHAELAARRTRAITASFSGPLHPAVDQPDPVAEARLQRRRARLGGGEVALLALLDQRAHPIGLPAVGEMPAERRRPPRRAGPRRSRASRSAGGPAASRRAG